MFSIVEYGAVGDGKTKNTDAFARAIAACGVAGGGRIIVPPGTWLTGPIELKSNIDLHLETGATVLFSRDYDRAGIGVVSADAQKYVTLLFIGDQ